MLTAALMVLAVLAGCQQGGVVARPQPRYGPGVLGKAKLMRDFSARIVGVVDVSPLFSHASTRGAVVLVDARLGRNLPVDDFHRRPVLVRYGTRRAAEQAGHEEPQETCVIRARDVLFFPAHFPRRAKDAYRHAMSAGLL